MARIQPDGEPDQWTQLRGDEIAKRLKGRHFFDVDDAGNCVHCGAGPEGRLYHPNWVEIEADSE